MAGPTASTLERDMARAINLMAHPTGAFAAASAIGLGLASQAMGIWFGAVAGAMEVTLRATEDAAQPLPEAASPAATRARAATKTLIEDAHSLAREVSEARIGARPAATATKPGRSAAAAESAGPRRAAVMARPAPVKKPAQPDDLKAIAGIGPKLEQVLNGLGIWTYGQIAGWNAAEIAWVEDQLGLSGRVGRDDWVAAAGRLGAASKSK
jgi:NADH-quinone oxidoreductase subunit E